MKEISDQNIHTICEAVHNVLDGSCTSKNKKICNHIKSLKNELRKVANPRYNIEEKRKILMKKQSGDGIFSIIAGVVLPFLFNLLTKKK